MLIYIDTELKLSAIKNAFHKIYPFLKIEFYKNSHVWQGGSLSADLLDENKSVGEVSHDVKPGFLEIHYWQMTGIVEAKFKNKFGLYVQVFRKYGESWIQTAGTDELTLEQQNESGRLSMEDLLHGNENPIGNEKKI